MRKSVMLEILRNEIESELEDLQYDLPKRPKCDRLAARILSVIERAGMQPPEVECPILFRKENKWED